ncbi:MAG TPA: glycosyltransferase family 1 protein [Anaerolineaceae bacterium]|nr:glycosyltransferase family 1 protein [Anaerolineaceae bacterium]
MKILYFANTDWFLYNYNLSLSIFMRSKGYHVSLLSPKGVYGEKLLKEGFEWHEFSITRKGMNPFRELTSIHKTIEILTRLQPDILHNFTMKSVLYGSLAAKKKKQIKTVNTITGMGYLFINNGILTRIIRSFLIPLMRHALKNTTVIFLNGTDRDYYLKRRIIEPEQAHLINGAGVDVEKFKPVNPEQQKKTRNIIFPARLLKDKGIYEFVEAARITKQQRPEMVFVLVGSIDEGNPSSIGNDELQEWLKEGVVEWWGWQNDMAQIYQQAFVVCLPSYREGLATSLIEAAACGIPLITTDVPGCRELVIPQQTGFLVPPHNSEALASSIIYMVEHPEQSIKMGLQGREFIVQNYSQEKVNAETYKLYSELGRV